MKKAKRKQRKKKKPPSGNRADNEPNHIGGSGTEPH